MAKKRRRPTKAAPANKGKPGSTRKKSREQKELEGNPGKRPPEISPPPAATKLREPPPAPECIRELPAALQLWQKLARQLTAANVLASTDLEALQVLCETWHTFVGLAKFAQPKNMIVKTRSGYRQEHPGVRLRAAAAKQLASLWRQFGLTPLTRESVEGDLPEDQAEDFANSRPN